MTLRDFLLINPILLAGLTAWAVAQLIKVPIEYITMKRWNWGLIFSAGGMPSSHSAMVSATALCIGMGLGFDTGVFALATIVATIVIYDATGVRREAGRQAALINTMIEELSKGKFPPQDKLKEVLGHTPGEAILGTLLGLLIGFLFGYYLI